MRLTVLGCGSVVPSLERRSSGYLLEADGTRVLMDLGSGTLRSMLECVGPANDVQALVLSHTHPDHTADLVPYFFALNYAPGWERPQPLPVYGPLGLAAFLEDLARPFPHSAPKKFAVQITELADGDERELAPGLGLQAFKVAHGDAEARAYRIQSGGKTFCFSGDTSLCPGLEAACAGADLFLCECTIPRGYPEKGGHMVSDQVGELAARAGVKRVLLTHLYPHGIDLVSQVKDHYDGLVELARDQAAYAF